MVASTYIFGDKTGLMLFQVGIDKQEENTCIQKLGIEHSIRD